jgi:hypothetical protein
MIKWWQDWRRGYSDLDMAFVKLMVVSGINPTFVRTLSNRQFNALLYLSENSRSMIYAIN